MDAAGPPPAPVKPRPPMGYRSTHGHGRAAGPAAASQERLTGGPHGAPAPLEQLCTAPVRGSATLGSSTLPRPGPPPICAEPGAHHTPRSDPRGGTPWTPWSPCTSHRSARPSRGHIVDTNDARQPATRPDDKGRDSRVPAGESKFRPTRADDVERGRHLWNPCRESHPSGVRIPHPPPQKYRLTCEDAPALLAGASAYRDGRSPNWSQIGHRIARAAGADRYLGDRVPQRRGSPQPTMSSWLTAGRPSISAGRESTRLAARSRTVQLSRRMVVASAGKTRRTRSQSSSSTVLCSSR
jgi:hypothetical protein